MQSMHDSALAEEISQNGGIGFAEQLTNSFQDMFEIGKEDKYSTIRQKYS